MRTNDPPFNPRQQPSQRHYNRERQEYDRDELRDVMSGGDYNYDAPVAPPNAYANRDYSRANYNFWPMYDEPQRSRGYVPSRDYGYERDEYYSMDPSHDNYRRSEATGYGNDRSVQGRDFERWMHAGDRYRNSERMDDFRRGASQPMRHRDDRDAEEEAYRGYGRYNDQDW